MCNICKLIEMEKNNGRMINLSTYKECRCIATQVSKTRKNQIKKITENI